jgi:hypothetical protein
MNELAVIAKLDAAKNELSLAEGDLGRAIREIRVAPRAEKTAISDVLEHAFARLSAARAALVDLEGLLALPRSNGASS